uniref:GPR180/TMEM145 transmembrane domain-containing protein n=1 Tax=Romanomermis culicivorax TaxID=13658 RepID=A0A915KNC2_ROMCU
MTPFYFNLYLGQIFLILIRRSCSKYVEGILSTDKDWAFLTRFCMLSEVGELKFEVTYPKNFAVQNILLYYDDPGQWPSVYRRNKVLSIQNNQILPLSTVAEDQVGDPICKEETISSKIWFYCSHSIKFTSHRERWWFLAIDNCESNMSYKIWMTNGNPDDFWFYQFSADEFYVLPTDLAFFCIDLIALVLSLYV